MNLLSLIIKDFLFLKEYFGNKLNYKYYQNTLHTVKKNNGELDLNKTKKILMEWPKKSSLCIKTFKRERKIRL